MNMIGTTQGALAMLASAQLWQRSTQVIGGGNDWRVHLFSNNVTITDASVLTDLTELVATGYTYIQPAWGTAALVGGVPTVASPLITFTLTGSFPSTVYGIYVTDALYTKFVGAANFAPSVTFTAGQPSYSAFINVTVTSQF